MKKMAFMMQLMIKLKLELNLASMDKNNLYLSNLY